MTDISLETVTGKLNRLGYDCFIQALRQAKGAGNSNLELAHWFAQVLQKDNSDLALTCDHYNLDRGRLLADVSGVVEGFRACLSGGLYAFDWPRLGLSAAVGLTVFIVGITVFRQIERRFADIA